MPSKSDTSRPLLKPFSPPPLCAPDPENMVKTGDNIMAIMQDGKKIIGKFHSAELNHDYFLINVEGQQKLLKIEYQNIKLVSLHDFRRWIDFPESAKLQVDLQSSNEVDFQIKFRDGDKLKGKTLGYESDRNGFYLYPTQKPGYFIYTFIPHNIIADFQFGPKIGEQLITDKLLTREQINAALEIQNEIRKKPIGEYFQNQALVTMKDLEQALQNQQNIPNIRLGELLIREKLITEEQLQLALKEQEKDRSVQIGEILVNQGRLSSKQIHQTLAKKLGIPYVDLGQIEVDIEALSLVPENIARQYEILPLHIYNNKLVVVTNDPLNWKKLDAIRFAVNMNVIPVMATTEEIREAINTQYSMKELSDESIFDMPESEIADKKAESIPESADMENIVVRLANKIIVDACSMRASDIHIEPHSGNYKTRIRMRKGGVLMTYHEISPGLRKALVMRLKVMANMNTAEKRLPQDGKINFGRFSSLKVELRIATIPTAGGEEDVVIRILASGKPMAMNELLLSNANFECTKHVLNNPYGLFLVCGPTGSGKTTTLHSLISHLNTPERKIWTVEDPVEFTQEGLRQVQVQPKVGLDFAGVLRAFLRADPDVIMVGEMRDKETASICVNASLTGHLVLSTLHTNSAVESVIRLLEMDIDQFSFSDALLGILAQRLARRLCPTCKVATDATEEDIQKFVSEYCYDFRRVHANESDESKPDRLLQIWKQSYFDENGKLKLYSTKGCKICDMTGYRDRLGLHEMLMATTPVTLAISQRARAGELLKIALNEGMRTITHDGIEKVLKGYTDMHEVHKFSIRL